MSDTPRTYAAFKESIQWDFPADYMRGKMEELERELSIESAEKVKYRERAWHAESQLEARYGLRKEINTELGLTDETGDDALRKGLETIKALKAERDRQAEFIACLRNVMGNILNDLPARRDWLDPTTERIACEYVHKGDVA